MVEEAKSKYGLAIEAAVLEAIRQMGLTEFRKTSFFQSASAPAK